ncbi:MAG: rhomboid family intramembrane serine protease [Pseudomonadales bacterium]|nr:rhomboid family intramembrane serine protease [Pseudomonadales bacterium]
MLAMVALLWLVEVVNALVGHRLNILGIFPREILTLPGVLIWPLLHGSFEHLIMNTTPLLMMGFFVALRGGRVFVQATLLITVVAGLCVWVFGRPAFHIGASGLVFGYFGLLVAIGVYEKSIGSLLIASFTIFYYGGLIFGVLPRDSFVSWEGHFFGLMAGVLAARLFAVEQGQRGRGSG